MSLEAFLIQQADELSPLEKDWPIDDARGYNEKVNPDALTDKWLESGTSYIWKVGVLAQWDSNKCDHARLFIGHERKPGQCEFIGMLYWRDGENDDIGRCLARYLEAASEIHPVFMDD